MTKSFLIVAILIELFASAFLLLAEWTGLSTSLALNLLIYGFLHGLATPWLARALWHQLPRKYRVPLRPTLMFLSALIFLIPFIGALGLWSGLVLALRRPKARKAFPVRLLRMPELPAQAPQVHVQLPYSTGALRQILRYALSPLKRVKAVMATRQMALAQAVPVLQIALRDRIDDVRLLAYSMRDSAEKKISDEISQLEQELCEQTGARAEHSHARVANLAYELVYAGLVQGAVARHWLQQAILHAAISGQTIAMAILRARLSLATCDYADAELELNRAEQLGASADALAYWRAELAYNQRDFAGVKRCLAATPEGFRGSDLAAVRQYWLAS